MLSEVSVLANCGLSPAVPQPIWRRLCCGMACLVLLWRGRCPNRLGVSHVGWRRLGATPTSGLWGCVARPCALYSRRPWLRESHLGQWRITLERVHVGSGMRFDVKCLSCAPPWGGCPAYGLALSYIWLALWLLTSAIAIRWPCGTFLVTWRGSSGLVGYMGD